jgi:ribosomal protein L15
MSGSRKGRGRGGRGGGRTGGNGGHGAAGQPHAGGAPQNPVEFYLYASEQFPMERELCCLPASYSNCYKQLRVLQC